MSAAAPVPPSDESFQPFAGVLACILPGLGYLWFGEVRRCVYAMVGVLGLFLAGLFIGGFSSVDRIDNKWWFIAQAGMGPAPWVVDAVNQNYLKRPDPVTLQPRGVRSIGKVQEVGSLMCAIAGMLNVIAVIDCFWHAPAPYRRRGVF